MEERIKRILDKVVLVIGAVVLMFWQSYDIRGIAGLFLCIGIFCSYEYCRQRSLLLIVCIAFIIAVIWHPFFLIWSAVLFYDVFYESEWLLLISMLAVFLYGCTVLESALFIGVGLLCLAALLLAYSTRCYALLDTEYKKQRDDSRELELILKTKNRDLMEKQDYEIHLATLRERNRIAREIHDNVGHLLSRSILQTGALKAINTQPELNDSIESLGDTLNQAMDSIRSSVHNLYEESLDLQVSIAALLNEYPGYEMHFTYELSEDLSKELKYCFLTVVKEALSNIGKHSNADVIQLTMKEFTDLYQLSIRDNGTAYNNEHQNGMGLESMKERVEAFNGNMNVKYQKGFHIFITIPKQGANKR